MTATSRALKGYKGRDSVSHRKYSFKTSVNRFKKSGKFTYRGKGALRGSGHAAGRKWGEAKEIDPTSRVRKYSKNSPSFDEGVYQYKESAKGKALTKSK